jgi:hypothetical protein
LSKTLEISSSVSRSLFRLLSDAAIFPAPDRRSYSVSYNCRKWRWLPRGRLVVPHRGKNVDYLTVSRHTQQIFVVNDRGRNSRSYTLK